MTKYEWEHELKKNIHRLPSDEIARVLDYYNEMFEDNIERGKSEREIIREFGNPVDVADKILSEYDGELLPETERTTATPFDAPPQSEKGPSADESRTRDTISVGYSDNSVADKAVYDGAPERKTNESNGRESRTRRVNAILG